MNLLFADRLPEQTLVDLESRGHVCVMEPGLGAADLPARIAGFEDWWCAAPRSSAPCSRPRTGWCW